MARDLLFRWEDGMFGCRAAAILEHRGCILLQQAAGDPGYAFPGGHVAHGETCAQALVRELREETGGEIRVEDLCWTGEVFFPWGDRMCHQVGLYFLASLLGGMPETGSFHGTETMPDGETFRLTFTWVPLEEAARLTELYPVAAKGFITSEGILPGHFVDREAPFAIGEAGPEDMDLWMYLVEHVRENFAPGLDRPEDMAAHRAFAEKNMARGTAICARQNGILVGVLPYSPARGQISFLAVHPGYRRRGIGRALAEEALRRLEGDVRVETFTAEDPRGTAPRALYEGLGFVPGAVHGSGTAARQDYLLLRE